MGRNLKLGIVQYSEFSVWLGIDVCDGQLGLAWYDYWKKYPINPFVGAATHLNEYMSSIQFEDISQQMENLLTKVINLLNLRSYRSVERKFEIKFHSWAGTLSGQVNDAVDNSMDVPWLHACTMKTSPDWQ
jgi:hypothetical protein